jgi:hypothetical protein
MSKSIKSTSQFIGIHPLVALGILAVDSMLFAGEAATLGASLLISIPVAVVLGIITTLVQRNTFGDDWMLSIGKGLLIGVLTAIPTPLPSVVTTALGVVGTPHLIASRNKTN